MAMLIAGGCGFVGLALAESLLGDGQTVVLFDINPVPPANTPTPSRSLK